MRLDLIIFGIVGLVATGFLWELPKGNSSLILGNWMGFMIIMFFLFFFLAGVFQKEQLKKEKPQDG